MQSRDNFRCVFYTVLMYSQPPRLQFSNNVEDMFSYTVATTESHDGGSEFKTIATKFLFVISAPWDLAYDNLLRKRVI